MGERQGRGIKHIDWLNACSYYGEQERWPVAHSQPGYIPSILQDYGSRLQVVLVVVVVALLPVKAFEDAHVRSSSPAAASSRREQRRPFHLSITGKG